MPEYTADIVNVGVANADMNHVYDIVIKMIMAVLVATISAIVVFLLSNRFFRINKIIFNVD